MEVYYQTNNGLYPFSKTTERDTLYFIEHVLTVPNPQRQEQIKTIAKIYRNISSPHLLKILKMLKDGQQFHFIYEYHPTSIEDYIKVQPKQDKRLQNQLGLALKALEKAGLKAQIKMQNIGVDSGGELKLFLCPESLELSPGSEELEQFYLTERTRIRFQLQDIYQGRQVKQEQIEVKLQKHPGFVIRGNELVFSKKQSSKEGTKANNIPQNIMSEIERQREITQKLKNRRHSRPEPKPQQPKYDKFPSQGSKEVEHQSQPAFFNFNRFSLDLEPEGRRESNRSSTGCSGYPNVHANIDSRMISSATDTSNKEYFEPAKHEERPVSSLRKEKKTSGQKIETQIHQQLKALARKHMENEGTDEEPKIQITTEMVSKYKMKIVTCQQIEFEGREGDDIEKIAQQKLLEYQAQHRYPQITAEPESAPEKGEPEQRQKKQYQAHNAQLMAKIMKAKEKASALKQLAKMKKK